MNRVITSLIAFLAIAGIRAEQAGDIPKLVINVTIDKRNEKVTFGSRINKQETWYGSALAIKYTNMVTQDHQTTLVTNFPRIYFTSSGMTASSDPSQSSGMFGSRR